MIRHTRRALCVCAATATMLLAPAVAQADVIGDWNAIAQAETVLLRPTAHGQSRGIAMVEGAVYDAVNAIDRGHQPYLARPRRGRRTALGLAGRRRRDGGLPGAPGDRRAGPLRRARRCLPRDPGAAPYDPLVQEGVDAGEAAAAAMLAARQNDGFMATFVPSDRSRSGRLAADRLAGRSGLRSRRLDRQPEAVPDREPVAVPLGGPERAHERGLCRGVRGGEGARRAEQHEANRRPDGRRRLLAVRSDRALEPARAGARRPVRPRYGRPGSSLRDDQPRRSRRRHLLLERQVLLELLAAEGRDPRGRHGRQPGDDRRPDLGIAVRAGDGDDAAARHAAVPRPPVRATAA